MTSPEKIEELLNRFGQTISDLPKNEKTGKEPYRRAKRKMASASACEWYLKGEITKAKLFSTAIPDECRETILRCFICHQSDVIERLIDALKVAEKTASCEYCKKRESNCGSCFEFGCEGFELDEQTL